MNTPDTLINTYGIKDVGAGIGKQMEANEFLVYQSDEVAIEERMYRPARSTHFSIHLNLDEAMVIKYNLINYNVPTNSLFIIHPGIVHGLTEVKRFPTISIAFTREFFAASMFHKKHVEALGFFSVQSNPLFEIANTEAETLLPLMLNLKDMANDSNHPFKEEMIYHGFNLFMLQVAAIAKKYRSNKEQATTRKEDILLGFLKQLAAHFREERSVQYYASTLYISPKHLTKTVKEVTGKTCGDFIDEMVITEAKILLGDLSYSVGQVADNLHFSDQFFFSKFFKRRTGLSPKEYKNSL